ncbi:MAG: hypothetical protein AAB656_01260 [Patescibacteria group bacterium]
MLKGVLKQFFQKSSIFFWILLIVGSVSWSLTMVKSGMLYPSGMGFWGPNGHDGIWHIALSESLARGSFDMPTFSGARLQNYHIGFDLLLAGINRLTNIPISTLYFQILPPLLAIAIGTLTYLFVKKLSSSTSSALWAMFFVYFGGSLGFIFNKGESAFWSQQAISTLINPPFALSLVLILCGLLLLLNKKYIFAAIVFGVLIEIKAYAGLLVLGSLLTAGVWRIVKERKFDLMFTFVAAFIISLIIFIPLNKNSGSLLVFQPFWFLETMMGLSDRIGWQRFYSAMTNYKLGGFWWKWIPAYTIAFVIFCVGNLGTRIVKDIWLFKKLKALKSLTWIDIFIFSMIGAGILVPTFFLQKGTPWNTIQFFYYSIFFSSILAGVAISHIKSKLALMLIVLVTIPTTILTLKDVYLPPRPPAKISNVELDALGFLRNQPSGIVLTYPFDEFKAKEAINNPPRPLYFYDSTSYVSAFSAKSTYLEDQVNLDITGYDWKERRDKVLNFISTKDEPIAKGFLTENNIKYLYLVKGAGPLVDEELRLGSGQLGLTKIFENNEVNIYLVN